MTGRWNLSTAAVLGIQAWGMRGYTNRRVTSPASGVELTIPTATTDTIAAVDLLGDVGTDLPLIPAPTVPASSPNNCGTAALVAHVPWGRPRVPMIVTAVVGGGSGTLVTEVGTTSAPTSAGALAPATIATPAGGSGLLNAVGGTGGTVDVSTRDDGAYAKSPVGSLLTSAFAWSTPAATVRYRTVTWSYRIQGSGYFAVQTFDGTIWKDTPHRWFVAAPSGQWLEGTFSLPEWLCRWVADGGGSHKVDPLRSGTLDPTVFRLRVASQDSTQEFRLDYLTAEFVPLLGQLSGTVGTTIWQGLIRRPPGGDYGTPSASSADFGANSDAAAQARAPLENIAAAAGSVGTRPVLTASGTLGVAVRRPYPGTGNVFTEPTFVLRRLKQGATTPGGQYAAAPVTCWDATAGSATTGLPTVAVANTAAIPCVRLANTTPATCADSQAYVGSDAVTPYTTPATGVLTGTAGAVYKDLFLLVAAKDAANPSPGTLTVQVVGTTTQSYVATGAEILGEAVVATQSNVYDSYRGAFVSASWRMVRFDLGAGVALNASGLATITVTSAADDWLVAVLAYSGSVWNDGPGTAPQIGGTFGNQPDYDANVDSYDLQTWATPGLAVPTAVSAAMATVTAATLGQISLGLETQRDVPVPTWTPISAGVGTQLQRRDARDLTYRNVEALWPYGVGGAQSIYDLEARIGVTARYRVRTIRAIDGGWSAWVETGDVAWSAGNLGKCETWLSSNRLRLTFGFVEAWGSPIIPTYELGEAAEVVHRHLSGRDYEVAFRPAERRGVKTKRTLRIAASGSTRQGVPDVVAAVRQFVNQGDSSGPRWALGAPPYVAVCDRDGNRFLASVVLSNLRVHEKLASVDMEIVEVTQTPVGYTG